MGGIEENEPMFVSVMCHMKMYSDTKLSGGVLAGPAALRMCQHRNIKGNDTGTSHSRPFSPALGALPLSASPSQCQTLNVGKITGLYTLRNIQQFSFPLSQGLSTLQNEFNWSQIVIEAGLFPYP